MKKTYTTPFAVEVEFTASNMLAISVKVDKNKQGNAGDAWSSESRGEWGNLWK